MSSTTHSYLAYADKLLSATSLDESILVSGMTSIESPPHQPDGHYPHLMILHSYYPTPT